MRESNNSIRDMDRARVLGTITNELYNGPRGKISPYATVSKSMMDPGLNAKLLKNRLEAIEMYREEFGRAHAYWVHELMKKSLGNIRRYGLNYAVKGAFAYMLYSKVQHYRYINENTFMTT